MYMHSRTSSNHFLRHATRSGGHFITLLFRSYMRSLSHTHAGHLIHLPPICYRPQITPSSGLPASCANPQNPQFFATHALVVAFRADTPSLAKEKRVILPLQTRIYASFKNNANKCTTPLRMHWCLNLTKIAKEVGDHPSPPLGLCQHSPLPRP